jgi:hypothetical protein
MNSILFILFGMIIWQTITFIVLFVTHEDDNAVAYTGCGLPLLIFNGIMIVLKIIRKIYIRKNYIMAIIWNEKGSDGKPMSLGRVRVKRGTIDKYYAKGENQYYIGEFTPEWKSFENEENIKHIRKNGWYCQEWINENIVKHI